MSDKTQATYEFVVECVWGIEELNATSHRICSYGLEVTYIKNRNMYIAVYPSYLKFYFDETAYSGIAPDAISHFD